MLRSQTVRPVMFGRPVGQGPEVEQTLLLRQEGMFGSLDAFLAA